MSITRIVGDFASDGVIRKGYVADATAGASAYTMASVMSGHIVRTPTGAAADTFPTAAAIVAYINDNVRGGCQLYDSIDVIVRNLSGGANTITISANTGLTLSGTMTIAQNNMKWFKLVVTNATIGSEAVTIYTTTTAQAV
jgi:hypothetical protein